MKYVNILTAFSSNTYFKRLQVGAQSKDFYQRGFAFSFLEKYWKKYQYAAKFVQLVRTKTPKVTFYTRYAKCMLMENSPTADVEVCFYDGMY